MVMLTGEEISERLIVGFESFLSLGIAFLSTLTGANIPPLSTPAICHLYGRDTPTTEFFLETKVTSEDDVCVASDWIVLLFQVVAYLVISWGTRSFLCDPLARHCLTDEGEASSSKRNVHASSRALEQSILHGLFAWCAWSILSSWPWLWQREQWSMNIQTEDNDPTVAPHFKCYYLVYAARSLSDFVALLFTSSTAYDDTYCYYSRYPRWDWYMHAVHHVVSVVLVLGLAMTGYIRIGCVLMFVMDVTDPVVWAAKLCHSLSMEGSNGWCQLLARRLLGMVEIVLALTRTVMWSVVLGSIVALPDDLLASVVLKVLCAVLVLLQLRWSFAIITAAVFKQPTEDDSRNECEEDNQEQSKSSRKRKRRRKRNQKGGGHHPDETTRAAPSTAVA